MVSKVCYVMYTITIMITVFYVVCMIYYYNILYTKKNK